MTANRKLIFQRLFDIVSVNPVYVTRSPKFRMWTDVPSAERPALVMLRKHELTKMGVRAPNLGINRLHCDFFIYTSAQGDAVPADQLDDLLDALDFALKPPPGEKFTLGGLVENCYKEGQTFYIPGDLDNEGMAVVPIEILVP